MTRLGTSLALCALLAAVPGAAALHALGAHRTAAVASGPAAATADQLAPLTRLATRIINERPRVAARGAGDLRPSPAAPGPTPCFVDGGPCLHVCHVPIASAPASTCAGTTTPRMCFIARAENPRAYPCDPLDAHLVRAAPRPQTR